MSKTTVITTRLEPDVLAGLDKLADHHDRSRAWLVAQAVARYVEEEGKFLAFLQEGEDAVTRGDFVSHEELMAEIRAMRHEKHAA